MASVIQGETQTSSYINQGGMSDSGSRAAEIAQAGKEQAKRLSGITRERIYQQVDSRKGELVEGLHQLVSTLETAGQNLPGGVAQSVLGSAVGVIRKASDRIENGSTEELLRDVQTQVRQRPGLFVAGCVALGFFAGRFLKI
jgi:hypothetical protein